MSNIKEASKKIIEGVTEGYAKIEEGVVSGYKKVETTVVGGFTKIADKFVGTFLTRDGETVEEAKDRIEQSLEASRNAGKRN